MVRKGSHKLITCPEDPPLLFDLASDPDELENLAGTPANAATHSRSSRPSPPGPGTSPHLDRAVRESQAARRLVSTALGTGARTPWDFQPMRDASRTYFRERGDIQASYGGVLR